MNSKVLTIITAVLSIIGIVLFAMVGAAGEDAEALSGSVSTIVSYSVLLLIAAIAVAVLGSLFGLLKNPAALKKTLLGIVGLGVVLLISYLISNANQVNDANGEVLAALGSSVSKLTSTGIWVSTVLLIVGGAFFIIDLLKGLVKS